MKETWNYELMDLLKEARLGNTNELDLFLDKYAPLAVVNADYSVLLVFRHFHANFIENAINVLNCPPENKNFQCGITIVTSAEDGNMQSNIYLPNNCSYKELRLNGNQVEIITDGNNTTQTNVTELFRKLDFWEDFTNDEIESRFKSLCNEQYESPKKSKVKNKTITLPSIGNLIYDENFHVYTCQVIVDEKNIELNIDHTTPKKLERLLAFADNQMRSTFYENMLFEMEVKMVALKNEAWLGKIGDTNVDEQPITVEEFRNRVSITLISFSEDCSSVIYCNDDDLFFGHDIEIRIDKNGKYLDANLAG